MSRDTVHKETTPHGHKTPHKYPSDDTTIIGELNDLSIELYPTGRAWYQPENGVFENFHKAINLSLARLVEDAELLIDKTLPDNDRFDEDDATLWEYRLGLITNSLTHISIRRAAIRRKLGHPNDIKARQHPLFIEHQLQLAGFNVWVHENTIPYRTPDDLALLSLNETQHGGTTQHGDGTQHGGDSYSVIANSIEPVEMYGIGGAVNLWATFFIGGEILGDIAHVPANRLREFKELVIKLKPAHTAAFTLINYL